MTTSHKCTTIGVHNVIYRYGSKLTNVVLNSISDVRQYIQYILLNIQNFLLTGGYYFICITMVDKSGQIKIILKM